MNQKLAKKLRKLCRESGPDQTETLNKARYKNVKEHYKCVPKKARFSLMNSLEKASLAMREAALNKNSENK